MTPVPLTSPDGVVRGYACALCHDISTDEAHIDACCRCAACTGPNPPRDDPYDPEEVCIFASSYCLTCLPAERARVIAAVAESEEIGRRYVVAAEAALAKAKDRAAAVQLGAEFAAISENEHCASWLNGIEWELWEERETRPLLKELSERAGGWWYWNHELHGELFVTFEEWAAIPPPDYSSSSASSSS